MASKKLYRVKKNHILEVRTISNYFVEQAFRHGYVFIKEDNKDDIYMINTTVTKKTFNISLIENIEVV